MILKNLKNLQLKIMQFYRFFSKLLAWVIGEYTNKLYFNDQNKIKQILEMLTIYLIKLMMKIWRNVNKFHQ